MNVRKIIGYMTLFALIVGIVSYKAQARPRRRRIRSGVVTSSAPKINIPSTALIGRQFTVQDLASLINTFNPSNNSDFLILTANGASASAKASGYNWESYRSAVVTLQQDANRINTLTANRCFPDAYTQQNYLNGMVWFTIPQIPNVAFYLIDPNPGRTVSVAGMIRSPASEIIQRWIQILLQRGIIQRFQ